MIPELEDAQKNTSYQQINYIFNKIKSVKWTIIACTLCILMTYLATSYVLYQYGSKVLWNGDSVIGLREEIKAINSNYRYKKSVYEEKAKDFFTKLNKYSKRKNDEIEALKSENQTLKIAVNDNIFQHIYNVERMSLEHRASLRADYKEWKRLVSISAEKENKIMFEQIISELPDETKEQWKLFQEQLENKDKTTTKKSHATIGN